MARVQALLRDPQTRFFWHWKGPNGEVHRGFKLPPEEPTHYDDLPKGHADWCPAGEFGIDPESTVFDHLHPDSPILEVRRLLGDDRTLRFWRWAEREGQRNDRKWQLQVWLPKTARRDASLTHAVGWDAAKRICREFRGVTLYIPNINFASRRQTRVYALILKERGLTPAEIAQEISLDWPVSVWTVRKILREAEE